LNNWSVLSKKSSVNKIAIHQRFFLEQENSNNSEMANQTYHNNNIKNIKFYSLNKVFKEPTKLFNGKKIWPKITQPKLPFSKINNESPELKQLKIKLTKPSKSLHEFNTIKWLRQKYSDSVIEKSIQSILPKKNKSHQKRENEHDKRYKGMLEYLDSFKGPVGREKLIDINPKYLFNESTFQKILKLKEIFLDFDVSGNQRMEFDEIVKMFNQNHIKAGKNDIVNLFFKHKAIKKKEDIMKLSLGFYQFINFALKKEEDFRNFMRKIKKEYAKNESNEYDGKKNESAYLPMNFNLVLDYFIRKEKERHSIRKLKQVFEQLDKDINKSIIDKNIGLNEKKSNSRDNTNRMSSKKINKNFNCNNDNNNILLSNININELFNEFITLFKLSCRNDDNKKDNTNIYHNIFNDSSSKLIRNKTEKKRASIIFDDNNISNNKFNIKINKYNRNNKSELKKYMLLTEPIKKNKNKNNKNKNNLIGIIKHHMNRNILNKITIKNFSKYNDVNLARDATLKDLRNELELDNLYLDTKEKNKLIKFVNIDTNQTINFFSPKKMIIKK
jgi:hypothetical protein